MVIKGDTRSLDYSSCLVICALGLTSTTGFRVEGVRLKLFFWQNVH